MIHLLVVSVLVGRRTGPLKHTGKEMPRGVLGFLCDHHSMTPYADRLSCHCVLTLAVVQVRQLQPLAGRPQEMRIVF